MMSQAILDLQFGSTGKGLLAGYLALHNRPTLAVCAFGPNAGHTYINPEGQKFIHMMLPTAVAASHTVKWALIGPGAVVDLDRLKLELHQPLASDKCGIVIHPNAVILQKHHKLREEASMFKVGSTMKGTAEAYIEKMRRDPDSHCLARHLVVNAVTAVHETVNGHEIFVSSDLYTDLLAAHATSMIVEGAQGCSLSIHSQFWPYCTSRDVSAAQLMADCAIPYNIARRIEVVGTARTFPIRVANRYNDKGEQIGTSGPCYVDQRELTWAELPRPPAEPEKTTVTQLVRRVFTFSPEQVAQSCYQNDVHRVFLNFANYYGDRKEPLHRDLMDIMAHFNSVGAPVEWLGWGPGVSDIEMTNGGRTWR